MAKHLVYLGFTGKGHRIALFDDKNLCVSSVPVKEVEILPNIPMLNCSIENGKPQPNLKGARVISSCPKGVEPLFNNRDGYKKIDLEKVWLRRTVEPDYLFIYNKDLGVKYNLAGSLLRCFKGIIFWDGKCQKSNYYVLAYLAVSVSKFRSNSTGALLCVDVEGTVSLLNSSDMFALHKCGANFIQAGTPELVVESVKRVITPFIKFPNESKVIWQGRKAKKFPNNLSDVEFVWWVCDYRSIVCDLRQFNNARVFGMSSVCDSNAVVFPESAEEIWLGFITHCPSLSSVYLPAGIKKLHEICLSVRRIKNIKFYTNSPVAIAVVQKHGATCVPCASADEMLEMYYESRDTDYVSVQDAECVASISNIRSDKAGESGTVQAAILLSCTSTGFATEEINAKYSVINTCDELPPQNYRQAVERNSIANTFLSEERTRLLAASFTLFYPYDDFKTDGMAFIRHTLGHYYVYLADYPSGIPHDKGIAVLLEDAKTGRVIHRFLTNTYIHPILKFVEDNCNSDIEPCGVLRYSDKLPVIYTYNYYTNDEKQIRTAIMQTLMFVRLGTRLYKRQLLGIDTHTGHLVTGDFTPYSDFRRSASSRKGINRLGNLKIYTDAKEIIDLLPNGSVFKNYLKSS